MTAPPTSSPAPADSLRLPTDVVPRSYDIEIAPDLEAGTFTGRVSIDVEVLGTTDRIVLHSLDLDIERAAVTSADPATAGPSSSGPSTARIELDRDAEQVHLLLPAPLPTGPATVEIEFSGHFGEQLVGFYRSTYEEDGLTHQLGVTQFEAPHARRAFPCWDEPEHKATFTITLVVDSELLAIANTAEVSRELLDDGRARVRFAPTMVMSTYLVAWVVGPLVATEPVDVDGVPVRIVCRPGQVHLTELALDIAAHSLRWLSGYYGIPYPGDKLDLVAVPDFAFGAMENLGCITFREVLLILDPDRLTQQEFERAATVIAHEIAHMWFGDLVTMRWWDGIWLNEAFATFMELSCTDAYRPDWSVWTTFGQARSGAFAVDATSHTRPIEFEVRTPSEAEAMFDVLTYEKGASVLRMVEQHLGPEPFRRAIGTYLDRHRYSSTETADLWVALDEVSDEPGDSGAISRVMTSWIRQGGHPLVSVERIAPDRVRIRQEHFAYRDPTRRTWSIPIGLRIAAGGTVSERRLLLTDEEFTVEVDPDLDWLCANANGVGFYRTTYDDTLRAALLDGIEALAPLERFDLLDDVWGFMVAGRTTIDAVIETLRALRSETHPAVLRRMSTALAELKLLGGAERRAEVAAFAASLVSDRHDTDPEVAGILLRIAGCVATTPDARAEAAALLERSERDGEHGSERVAAELVAAAVDVVATQGGAAEFDRFVDRYRGADTPQEELRYLAALTRFDHEDLQDRLLAMCLDEVRAQNAPFTLAQAMSNPRLGSRAWTFVRDHWDEVTARFPTSSIPRMIGGVRSIWDPVAAADIIEFFDTHPQEVGERQIAQHLELVTVQQDTLAREAGRLAAALG